MPPGKKQTKLTKFVGAEKDEQVGELPDAAPKRRKIDEDTYKDAREVEGLPYVGNGSRDKFCNLKKNTGGRPLKLLKIKPVLLQVIVQIGD